MCASDTHTHTPHHSQVDSVPPRSQLHLFSVKDSWGFMTQKKCRRARQNTSLVTFRTLQTSPPFFSQCSLVRCFSFVRFLLWYFDLCVRRKVTSSKPKCGLKWWINTHSHTPWRCHNQIPCGVLLYGDLLRIFSWLLLRLSESSQIHLIHPLTHSHTLHGLSKPSPWCTFPPPPAVTLIIYRSLIFHTSPLFNVPVPQSPSTLFLIPCSFRLLSSHSPFFYPMTPFFSTS